jgi:hypothetical protein
VSFSDRRRRAAMIEGIEPYYQRIAEGINSTLPEE